MAFDTGLWLDSHHAGYNLSNSGMSGVLDIKKYFNINDHYTEKDFINEIASLHDVDPHRIVITHGATEAFGLIMLDLMRKGFKTCNVNVPEYELIYKTPEIYGYKKGEDGIYALSLPNNPTGTMPELKGGYKTAVIDETFYEFYSDLNKFRHDSGYLINTFTKFYAGDDLKLGYIIAPDRQSALDIYGYKGLVVENVSYINVSAGVKILRDHDKIASFVRGIVSSNHRILINNMGKLKFYKNIKPLNVPVSFVDYSEYTKMDSDKLSDILAKNGVSAVPARLFGVNGTYLRVCITRPDFPEAFDKLKEILENIEKL